MAKSTLKRGWVPIQSCHPMLSTGENVQDVVNAHKEKLIGKTALKKFGVDLPLLPKVLPTSRPPLTDSALP